METPRWSSEGVGTVPIPVHWLDPVQYVPLCVVVGTCAKRDEDCLVVRSAEGVTCPECVAAMKDGWRVLEVGV